MSVTLFRLLIMVVNVKYYIILKFLGTYYHLESLRNAINTGIGYKSTRVNIKH